MKISIQAENLRSTTVPAEFEDDILLHRKFFYTLPAGLLTLLVAAVGKGRFDVERLDLERALSRHVGDHRSFVGVLNCGLIPYHLFGARNAFQFPEELVQRLGWSQKDVETAKTQIDRLDALGISMRGFAGWLLTNPVFLNEHDDLFRKNQEKIRRHGIPKPVMARPVFGKVRKGVAGRSSREPFILEFRDFCKRWRLQTFAGPYLPLPLEPQIPNLLFKPEGLVSCEGVETISIPDVFPTSGRGMIQSSVDAVVHGGEKPDHLANWFTLIDSTNSAKNPIHRYERLFQFQHFVHVLYSRHADALYRKKTHVVDALAEYFQVTDDTIKSDWKFLDDNVGNDWMLRKDPLS